MTIARSPGKTASSHGRLAEKDDNDFFHHDCHILRPFMVTIDPSWTGWKSMIASAAFCGVSR
jgi:hypothetical protein